MKEKDVPKYAYQTIMRRVEWVARLDPVSLRDDYDLAFEETPG
jgi:hypothetical protein